MRLNEIMDADCVIVAVAHNEFRSLGIAGIKKLYGENSEKVLIDVKGIFKIEDLKESNITWWRL